MLFASDASLFEKIYASFNMDMGASDLQDVEELEARARASRNRWDAFAEAHPDPAREYWRNFLTEHTYHTNALEGSTLSKLDTELVLEGEFIPSDRKELQDMFAARGCAEGLTWALARTPSDADIDVELVKDVHERTALDLQPAARGIERDYPVYIRGSRTVPADAHDVRELLDWLTQCNRKSDLPALVKAAAFHAMYEHIHPFRDGNGRSGRIILNLMLQRGGMFPIAIRLEEKRAYIAALEQWQCDGAPEDLLAFVSGALDEEVASRNDYVRAVEGRH